VQLMGRGLGNQAMGSRHVQKSTQVLVPGHCMNLSWSTKRFGRYPSRNAIRGRPRCKLNQVRWYTRGAVRPRQHTSRSDQSEAPVRIRRSSPSWSGRWVTHFAPDSSTFSGNPLPSV